MRASVSVQRISTSIMKVIGIISLFVVYVSARGSGPYLPSGWKPDGPAFYLPSEVAKPLNEPVKEIVVSESEASGSDFLREYGPPKVQEVSQDITQQGLPGVVNEQLFVETFVETTASKENSNVETEVTEEKLDVVAELKSAEEAVAVTGSQLVVATESIANIEEEAIQVNEETTTSVSAVESIAAVDEFGYLVEPTVAVVVPTEKITIEANAQSENQILTETVEELQQLTSQQEETDQSVSRSEDSAVIDSTEVTAREESSTDVSEKVESSSVESLEASVTQVAEISADVISAVEEKVETVEEEVKTVEQVVQNIPELIVALENEVKTAEAEAIQEIPAVVQEIFGSLDQAPEGFLEYGPPGFREYGPPKEDLKDNTIEEKIQEIQPFGSSEVRRRRFSPKFKSSPKSQ